MELKDFLHAQRELYVQGVTSLEGPDLLYNLGGVLALAALDAPRTRTERGGYLGVIDRPRSWFEQEAMASARWREHASAIRQLAARNKAVGRESLDRVMASYVRAVAQTAKTIPVEAAVKWSTEAWRPTGQRARWLLDIEAFRHDIQRGLNVMTDTIPALVAGAEWLLTDSWEWGMQAGEFAKGPAGLLGVLAPMRAGISSEYAVAPNTSSKPGIIDRLSPNTTTLAPDRNTGRSSGAARYGVAPVVSGNPGRYSIPAYDARAISAKGVGATSRGTSATRGLGDRAINRGSALPRSTPARGTPQNRAGDMTGRAFRTPTQVINEASGPAGTQSPGFLGTIAVPSKPRVFEVGGRSAKSWFKDVFVGTSRKQFREQLQRLLRAMPESESAHALLQDGKLLPSNVKGQTMEDWKADPRIMDSGHFMTKSVGGADVIIIMSKYRNQKRSADLERHGGVLGEFVLIIDRLAYHPMTAWDLVDTGRLRRETVERAPKLQLASP